eukprot:GDKK01043254.1.p1 GENE.GDKK01043254.1~~GDKK01043254.1.p1  ORF type:complete len:120 (-),score=3.07 GDKK01043254.1:446-805(-)
MTFSYVLCVRSRLNSVSQSVGCINCSFFFSNVVYILCVFFCRKHDVIIHTKSSGKNEKCLVKGNVKGMSDNLDLIPSLLSMFFHCVLSFLFLVPNLKEWRGGIWTRSYINFLHAYLKII